MNIVDIIIIIFIILSGIIGAKRGVFKEFFNKILYGIKEFK